MTRAAIYARYSSDNQREASIEDPVRICKEFGERQGWTVVKTYADRAILGASLLLRPGVQQLIASAGAAGFDVILAESLDRLSRDQEDIAGIYEAHGLRRRLHRHPVRGRYQRTPYRRQGHVGQLGDWSRCRR